MPFPDSQYPSVIRGYDKRQSERLLNAAPDLLAACKKLIDFGQEEALANVNEDFSYAWEDACRAVAKAEGQ